jgi:hypothetical protein
MTDVFKLIEVNGLTLHGDIEHFAELVRADEREAMVAEALAHDDADAIIIQYHESTIKWLEKRIEELTAQPEQEPLDFAYVMEAGDDRWKKLPIQERNFCQRCGKRTADLTTIHTCTPPKENK